ncbi:MAG: phosphoglycerate dehydrogenase [Oscillospiraceae bacterium]|jgi:D-3-phosphoglycerate dehydrogenase|nr:phosphoglycerate dehydrogenase [Oscillospiraceae bacterium]
MKILVTPTSLGPASQLAPMIKLLEFADEIVYNPHSRPLTEDELIPLLEGCDGYLAGLDFITEKALNTANNLKVISRYGIGCDRVDLEAAKKLGITVTNTPGANAGAVADLTLGLILAVARAIPMLDHATKQGKWIRKSGIELGGKTLGLLGFGMIGKQVARRATGFGMKVIAYDPFIDQLYAKEHDVCLKTLEQVITESDFLSLHLPLTESTQNIIDKNAIEKMRSGAVVINTSRGGLIDESALYQALQSGHLSGAALDAYESEPPDTSRPLYQMPNVVTTPHTGAHTLDATLNMATMAVDNLINVLSSKDCPYIITKE